MHLGESKFAIFSRREKLIRFVYKCMPQILKLTTKQQDSWYKGIISIAQFVLKTKEIVLMWFHCVEHLFELSYRACVLILTFKISKFDDNLTYTCFVYWCMHLHPHNLVHALVYETTWSLAKMGCFVYKSMHLNAG